MKQPQIIANRIVIVRRIVAVVFAIVVSTAATQLFIRFTGEDGFSYIDVLRCGLIAISTAWLAWGAALSVFGLTYSPENSPRLPHGQPLAGRTAILVPVYNEDPISTFSRIAAMDESVRQSGAEQNFHFAILSDTTSEEIAAREALWFARMLSERNGAGRIFYRRRMANTGKKAGNIEDFIRRSGGAYEYVLILDADSLMEGATIVEMARRIEADPKLGLLQTLPTIIYAKSFFGRAMQFSASYFSPIFARGVAMLQGFEGPFWGHNAIVRTTAFAESCGLPQLSGKPPFGGHILSHDYVEAALLARAGWRVRLDPDLAASYEESPENLLEHAKRDRRWCQGNLQYGRLLLAPKLRLWSRFVFAQGIMAYLASPLWLLFLVTSIAAPFFAPPPNYFPEPHFPFPIFPANETIMAVFLVLGITCLLILPKVLIVCRGAFTGENVKYGGTARALASTLAEVFFSSLVAPLMLWFQSRAVLHVLLGADGGWPATNRDDGQLSLREAWSATRWIVFSGMATLGFALWAAHAMLIWLIPIAGPMILSPWLITASSRNAQRSILGYVFATPSEFAPSPILAERDRILEIWGRHSDATPQLDGAERDAAGRARDVSVHVEA
jgi:membrane glycosyltransferase